MAEFKDDPLFRRELEHSRLLKGVQMDSAMPLLQEGSIQELKKGDVLIQAGESNRSLYLLLSGRLSIRLRNELEPIAILGPGDVVGELSLIDGQLTSAYVIVDQDCRLAVLTEKTVWALVETQPAVARNLLFILARRLRHLTNQQLQREYAHYTVIDGLTGLYNRHWLDSMLVREMERCKRGSQALSVLLIGLDSFRSYRQRQGKEAANRVLQTIASVMRENLRPGEMIARYGEDEFMILLPDSDLASAVRVGERLRAVIGNSEIRASDQDVLPPVTVSVGIKQMGQQDTPESVIAQVDSALRLALESGGNRVVESPQPG